MDEHIGQFRSQIGSKYESPHGPDAPNDGAVTRAYRVALSNAIAMALEALSTQELAALPLGGVVYVSTDSLNRTPRVDDIIVLYARGQTPRIVRYMDGRLLECVASFSYALMDLPIPTVSDWEVEAIEHPSLLDFLLLDRLSLLTLLVRYAQALAMDFRKLGVRI